MMKKVLIVGKTSYIGLSFQKWIQQSEPDWIVNCISSRDHVWELENYGKYDTVLHVAGIAHVDASKDMEEMYYRINRDLAVDSCRKAKEEGCKQFVFLSSLIVYGESNSLAPVRITKDTVPHPNGFYGQSKLDAETGIFKQETEGFSVAAIRPPMVYGKGSKGNYPKLAKLATSFPIFPEFSNQRSMIHIDNLCECIRLVIAKEARGVFCPQNKEYVSTTELVCEIARNSGKRMHTTRLFNPLIRFMAKRINIFNKVFGSFVYEKELSDCFGWSYCVHDFKESIKRTQT